MAELPTVLLLCESSSSELRWRELLAAVKCSVVVNCDLSSGGVPIDIVITDSQQQLEAGSSKKVSSSIYAVIGFGAEVAADVGFLELPTERELQIACDLLYEIVQLRREREKDQQMQQLLTEMAELDELTGLANRRAWDAELARRMKLASGEDSTLCLALLDLDHFKKVNTAYGYAVADKVLQQSASALQASVRSEDFVARIGGDEFGLLLSNIPAERAEAVVDRIRASIESSLVRMGSVVTAATAGLALRQRNHDAVTLFSAADANLRLGKAAGRNRTIAST